MNHLNKRITLLIYLLLGICILIPLILLTTLLGIIGQGFIHIFKYSNNIVDYYERGMNKIIKYEEKENQI